MSHHALLSSVQATYQLIAKIRLTIDRQASRNSSAQVVAKMDMTIRVISWSTRCSEWLPSKGSGH